MKGIGIAITILLFMRAEMASVRAQTPPPAPATPTVVEEGLPTPANNVTVNVLGLLYGGLSLELERAISRKVSFFLGPSFAFASAGELSMFAVGGVVGIRVFLSRAADAPRGLWIGPAVAVWYQRAKFPMDDVVSATGFSAGGLVGYTWIFERRWVVSVGGGLQYVQLELEDADGATIGFTGIAPAVRASLGVAF